MINMFQPQVTLSSVDLIQNVFESNWLGRGKLVEEFESKLANFISVERDKVHTISCCTDAIFGAFDILGIKPGAEVIIPSISFPAVGSAAIAAGIRPRIVDVNINSGNINLTNMAAALNNKTAAVFVTHYGGIPVDIPAVRKLVGDEVFIIEDSACALGTYINGIACGTQGDYGCWSFDAMKLLTCGEGGGIYISDANKMVRAKEYFYLGLPVQTKSGIDRQETHERWWEYELNCLGRRSVFTNINAAIGLPQFDALESSLKRRQIIREYYCNILDALGCEYLVQDDPRVSYSNYFFTIKTPYRDRVAKYLKENSIYSTFRYYPLHKIKLFSKYADNNCVEASQFSDTALNIPIHNSLSDLDVDAIGCVIKSFFKTLYTRTH